jgi:hypothetical protein
MPEALRNGLRIERYGAPFDGGWMRWPLRWLIPVEAALNVYQTLSSVKRAMHTYSNNPEALARWQEQNGRLLEAALDIEAIRNEEERRSAGTSVR